MGVGSGMILGWRALGKGFLVLSNMIQQYGGHLIAVRIDIPFCKI